MTRRERGLRIALPALILVAAYVLLVPPPSVDALEAAVEQAQATPAASLSPPPAQGPGLDVERELLRDELVALTAGGAYRDDPARLAARRQFVGLLEEHGVAIVDHAPGGGEDFDYPAGIGALLETPAAAAARAARPEAPPLRQVYSLRLRGGYLAVLDSLEALAADELRAIPLSLALDQLDPSGYHAWTLVVWV